MTQCSALAGALKNKGWGDAELAAQSGVPQQRVSDIVSGRVKPSESEFKSICGSLGVTGSFDHVMKAQ